MNEVKFEKFFNNLSPWNFDSMILNFFDDIRFGSEFFENITQGISHMLRPYDLR